MKEYFMGKALEEAAKAYKRNEIPIGAVIVHKGKIIAQGYNKKENLQDATEHAEMRAIKKAQKKLGTWRLEDCEIYVTLEPCSMCVGALLNTRIKKIFIGTANERMGACGSSVNLCNMDTFNHKIIVEFGVLEKECSKILSDFFIDLRKSKADI